MTNENDTVTIYQPPGRIENTRFERIHNVIFENSVTGSKAVAREIKLLIEQKQSQGAKCVLGLATGSSPIKVYEELVRFHKEEGLSFSNVITFNLDEYLGLAPTHRESYHYFMDFHLFSHIDIPSENIHIPDGTVAIENYRNYCNDYEKLINDAGGIDFQLLGIGRTGHIGFNEPGSHINSITRVVSLNHITRLDAASSFHGIRNVPKKAISMGIRTVLKAKRVVLLSWGSNKAPITAKAIEQEISPQIPATYLQEHKNATFVLDVSAAQQLTRIKTPWLVGDCDWNEVLKIKAVVWLSKNLQKSILKLTENDYSEKGMSSLLAEEGSAYELNIKIFNKLQRTITGWPGGKSNVDDRYRPERALPDKKRVLIFSPHPDDDVISMGGTLDRLIEQGHEVHVAYQTSGNIAVSNEEALKFAQIAATYIPRDKKLDTIVNTLNTDQSEIDMPAVRHLKGLIRRSESYLATQSLEVPKDHVHFLDLPFYETGTIKKDHPSSQDLLLMTDLIREIKPHQIYAAGDLSDPHGTHKVCLDLLLESLRQLKSESFLSDCWLWLYRGAWEEWSPCEIDMAVPMSPDQVLKKRRAIFYHQSQKDGVMFQGEDAREFWVRAEDRNRQTAHTYNALGLANYAAMEAFKRYHF